MGRPGKDRAGMRATNIAHSFRGSRVDVIEDRAPIRVKIVNHEEAAAEQIFSQLVGLVLGKQPVANFDGVISGQL